MIIFSSSIYFEPIYKSLTKAGFKIDFLVTESPKCAGRGQKICQNPAHIFAKNIGLPIITDLKSFSNTPYEIRDTKYEISLVFAYGKIISQDVINKFKYGILNIHPSLLPKYRGATPVQTAILNGDKKTGFSIIKINPKCDCGDILNQERVAISDDDNFETLLGKIMNRAVNKLPEILKKYLCGKIKPTKQDEAAATYTQKISKSDGEILKSEGAREVMRKIRAYSLWPKAYFIIDGKRVIVHEAKLVNGKISLMSLQVEGKNKISFSDFKQGYSGLLTKFPKFVRITEE